MSCKAPRRWEGPKAVRTLCAGPSGEFRGGTTLRWGAAMQARTRSKEPILGHGKAPALVHRALPSIPCPSCVTLNKSFLLTLPQFPHVHEEVLHTDSYIIPSDSHTRFVNARHTVGLQHKPMVIVVIISTLYPSPGGGGQPCPKMPPTTTRASVFRLRAIGRPGQ